MNTNEQLIFLLRGAIGIDSGEPSCEIGRSELIELYNLSKKHDVAHIVGAALEKRGSLIEGEEISRRFQKEQLLAVYRCENLDYEYSAITRALDGAGIDHMPLKGSVIRSLYPEAWMRTSCDIDVLVREEDLERACDVLVNELSYKVQGNKDYHDISLFSESGIHLELHYSIKEKSSSMDAVLDRVWNHSARQGGNRYSMTNEFLIFHVIAHAAYHFAGGGCGVRPVMDIKILREKLEYDERKLNDLLAEAHLDAFAVNLFALCDAWFGEGEADDLICEMQEYIITGGAYGSVDQNLAVNLGRTGSKAKYILTRVFLPYSALKIHYPVIERHKILIPLCQVRRWFTLISPKKRRKIARELRANSDISQDDVMRTLDLLSRLGIEIE